MFTANRLQVVTYLLGVCFFTIAFLVFINSTVSFVITSLIKQRQHVGNAVGTLGFADELIVIVASPAWGFISDMLGVRTVCALGYAIIGLALLLFVQATNVFPQLLIIRIFFSVGGAATSTMVTAILPSIGGGSNQHLQKESSTSRASSNRCRTTSSITSELTVTPNSPQNQSEPPSSSFKASPMRLAGIVGLSTGFGALLALGVFLRLPELIQRFGVESEPALVYTYYVVGASSLVLSPLCHVGLRHLDGEGGKGWRALLSGRFVNENPDSACWNYASTARSLPRSIALGFSNPSLALGYLGGFVARSSSVGISLFVPLFVNSYYISSGHCDKEGRSAEEVKESCREAYVLAAELSGVSQLVALIFAPLFGYLADRYRRFNLPLLIAAFLGVVGYIALAALKSPEFRGQEGSLWVLVIMAILGMSQIGAIVCSLGLLGRCVLELENQDNVVKPGVPHIAASLESARTDGRSSANMLGNPSEGNDGGNTSATPLLPSTNRPHERLKGSIAGVYSLAGGIGILILTKAGGKMFDTVSIASPFYMLALFNGLLLLAGIFQGLSLLRE